MGSSGSDHAPSSVLCRAPPCHGSPSSPPSPHAGKFIGRWWMIWTEIAPIWGYYWKCCWKEWKWQLQAHLPSFQSQFNFNENVPPPNTQVSGLGINLPSNILTTWHDKQSSSWHHKKSSWLLDKATKPHIFLTSKTITNLPTRRQRVPQSRPLRQVATLRPVLSKGIRSSPVLRL